MVQLHEKPSVSLFKATENFHKASVVYTAKPTVNPRGSTDCLHRVKVKKRTPSPQKSILQDLSTTTRSTQNMHVPTVRKFHPGNSAEAGVKPHKAGNSLEGNGKKATTNGVETGGKLVHNADNRTANNVDGPSAKKTTKVFLSEKQSRSLRECGVLVPCAPPATPTPEHRQKFDIIPSLTDVRAQRHMRQRLEGISKTDTKKAERRHEEHMRQEKLTLREKVAETKRRQRQEIYALNKVMTDLEYSHFESFVKERGYNL